MRRHSPPRAVRHRTPLSKRRRLRSLSPLSRSQPAPPGEERDRKSNLWDGPHNKNKRYGGRPEWADHPRDPLDRDHAYIHMEDNDRPRGRDRGSTNRDLDKSRGNKGKSDLKHRRSSMDRHVGHLEEFEESYLDHHPNLYGAEMHKNHDNIVNPAASYSAYEPRSEHQEKLHQHRKSHHDSTASARSVNKETARHVKEESSAERINRLEKLVEKLVENNSTPGKPNDFKYQQPKDEISELIPSNSKFTTSMWINSIHEECLNRSFDEKSSIRFMQDRMTGIMKAWFKTVSNYDFTWPELKLLITKTFPDNLEFSHTLKLLVAREKSPEETITQYYFSKVYLCEACKITGENAVSCIIDGLTNPFMKQDIKSFNFLTPEALFSDYLSKYPESDIPIRMDRREVLPDYPEDAYMSLEVDNRERDSSYRGGDSSGRRTERKKCFTCKKFGHLTVDCRHAPICYTCKKKGHIAAKCSFNNALLIESNAPKRENIPEIQCAINGKGCRGILDTGSVAVTLKEQIASRLGLKVRPTREVLKGYGGSMVVPLGETDVLLKINSCQRPVRALIIEDRMQAAAVIVGQEFLSQIGVSLCQKNGKVTVFDCASGF